MFSNGTFDGYEYDLKDHFSNTRVIIDEQGTVLEKNDYYPFSMIQGEKSAQPDENDNKYLYYGKELQTDLNLDWYDYGARFYDAQLGRFHTVDRFAEKYMNLTPYQYAANNPILFIDIFHNVFNLF